MRYILSSPKTTYICVLLNHTSTQRTDNHYLRFGSMFVARTMTHPTTAYRVLEPSPDESNTFDTETFTTRPHQRRRTTHDRAGRDAQIEGQHIADLAAEHGGSRVSLSSLPTQQQQTPFPGREAQGQDRRLETERLPSAVRLLSLDFEYYFNFLPCGQRGPHQPLPKPTVPLQPCLTMPTKPRIAVTAPLIDRVCLVPGGSESSPIRPTPTNIPSITCSDQTETERLSTALKLLLRVLRGTLR